MAKYKILYWHGIPSQVRATDENGRVNKQLPPRFQEAIDEAAMSLGKIGTDSYTDGFQWGEEIGQPGTAEEVAETVASKLDKEHPTVDWRSIVKREDTQ
jgi:hypothetical protein